MIFELARKLQVKLESNEPALPFNVYLNPEETGDDFVEIIPFQEFITNPIYPRSICFVEQEGKLTIVITHSHGRIIHPGDPECLTVAIEHFKEVAATLQLGEVSQPIEWRLDTMPLDDFTQYLFQGVGIVEDVDKMVEVLPQLLQTFQTLPHLAIVEAYQDLGGDCLVEDSFTNLAVDESNLPDEE